MDILKVQHISSAVSPTVRQGTHLQVHSTFRRVVNLICDGRLLSFIDEGVGRLPNGLFVQLPENRDFEHFGIRPGSRGYREGNRIVLPQASLAFDYSQAGIRPSEKSIEGPLLSGDRLHARLAKIFDMACRMAPDEGLAPLWKEANAILNGNASSGLHLTPFTQVASSALLELVAGLREQDTPSIQGAASSLAGLGIGLTPSGDDVLTGLVAALALWASSKHEPARFRPVLSSIRDGVGNRTNLIALNYLHQAMRCEISDELYSFIHCMVALKTADLRKTIQDLFAYGASSGSELGLGAYLGVSAIRGNL